MSSKQILASIDPIAVAARAALERNREMLDRADSIALAPKRIPEITLPDPESVREVEYDPDSVAAYVLDSLASVAARTVQPKGVDNPSLELKDRQHNKTTYDEAGRRFLDDVEKNMRTGNLPISGKFSTETINLPTMGGRHEGVLLKTGDRELETVYDLLFKPRAYREVGRILKHTK